METTTGSAKTPEAEFIEASRTLLRDDYLPKLLHCVERMSDEDLWWRPNDVSNSAGNLILHLCGNVRQWIVASIGGAKIQRDRDSEFTARGPIARAELLANLKHAMDEVDAVLSELDSGRLLNRVKIQKYEVSTLQAVYHVAEHFSYHLGQILYIYKMRSGVDPAFYRF
jgi:uncharacterized damage-inducible protein DinB